MKLAIVTVSNPVVSDMVRVNKRIKEEYGDILQLKLFYVGRGCTKDKLLQLEESLEVADFIILDLMGASELVVKACARGCGRANGNIVNIGGEREEIRSLTRLGSLTAADMGMGKKMKKEKNIDMEAMMKMMEMAEKMGKAIPFGKPRDMRNFILIGKYWNNASEDEMTNLLYLILRDYGKIKYVPKPIEPKENQPISICEPKTLKRYENWKEYFDDRKYYRDKPLVVVMYYGHSYPNRTSGSVGKIVEKLEEFSNVLPIAFTSANTKNIKKLESILSDPTLPKIELVINFMAFRLGAGPMGGNADAAVDLLKKIGVPYLHPYFISKRRIEDWEESIQGMSPPEFLIHIMLPELDGCIETIPVGAIKVNDKDEELDVEISEVDLIWERVEKVVARVKKWLELRRKENSEKKVAIICYNYPPGEDNLFGGAFLDTFVSVEKMLKALKYEGYNVEDLSASELMENFTAGKIANSGRWINGKLSEHMISYDSSKYKKDLMEKSWNGEMLEEWGQVPGDVMTEDGNFIIPGKVLGNVFVGLQPSRGIHENPEKVYHDKTIPPHHQYLAFYKWLKEEFKADMIIHVGTHGTLEFLKGKECGMSGDCFPDMLVYDIPHAYIYYSGNPSEAVIAKRRSHATLVSYQAPSYVEGELYGDLLELETHINEFHEAERVDPARCDELMSRINDKAKELNFDGSNLDSLEGELYRIKRSLIPKGLHVFGQGYEKEEAENYMRFVLRYDRGEIKSIRRLVAEKQGLDYDKILDENDTDILSRLDIESSEIIDKYLREKTCEEEYLKTLEYGIECLKSAKECCEMDGLLKVLRGEYLPAKLAGDMFRSPEVLPTGFNLYQFDPRLVPSEVACERGKKIAENTLKQYKEAHNQYPSNVALVLWGLETSRTQGETLGQIFHYLGVRPYRKKNLFDPKYEIISLEELGRPRIDVTINMCGFFRDMFGNMIEDMNKIFKEIYMLDEPDDMNYFKANSKKIYEKLIEEGHSQEEAEELCYSRIFGPKEGEYGTGVTKLIETKNWTDERQIGETFINSLRYVYSRNYNGRKVEGLYDVNLKTVDVVSQTRSNHEYEVTDLDHYYEYFGGLAKSVEIIKGKKAEIYITDTTGEKVETETVDKSIERGVRTRLLNPKWIDGMLEHKYHGVQKINDRFENVLGLAATTNKVDNWVFSSLHSTYVSDEKMRERLKENNRWAYLSMLERLFESNERGYWNASEEEMEELRKVYFEVEGNIEEKL